MDPAEWPIEFNWNDFEEMKQKEAERKRAAEAAAPPPAAR